MTKNESTNMLIEAVNTFLCEWAPCLGVPYNI